MNPILNSSDYEHPTDRTALAALQSIPLFNKVLTWWLNFHVKTDMMIEYRGNGLEVTERTCPRVWRLKQLALDRLSIEDNIPIFLTREWDYNAFATGVTTPMIVLHSGIVEDLTNDELLSIIGHEMGHIKSQHMLYHYMARTVAQWAFNNNIVSAVVMQTIIVALMEWQRKSELTADRAGFIASQNKEACIWAMMKLMGLPEDYKDSSKYEFTTDEVLKQYENSHEDITNSAYKKLIYAYITANISHPWTIERIHEIEKWEGILRE